MVDSPGEFKGTRRPPLHYWIFGLLSLFWNALGAFIAIGAQSGELPHLRGEERAYFAAQEQWLVIIADIGLLAGIAGAVALLLQHKSAVTLYTIMFVVIAATNLYDIASGTSPLVSSPESIGPTAVVITMMALQVFYALAMKRAGYLE